MADEVRTLLTRYGADTTDFTAGAKQVIDSLQKQNTAFYQNREEMKKTQKEINVLTATNKKLEAEIKDGKEVDKNTADLKKNRSEIEKLTTKLGMLKTTQQTLQKSISSSTSKLKQQNTELTKTQGKISNLGTTLKLLATGYAGKTVVEALFGSNAQFEQYSVSLEVLLGDAQKARNMMEDLTKFSAVSPFTTEQVVPQANLLLSYGVEAEKLIGTMTKLGNLSQGNAEKFDRISLAYGQVLAKGKVQQQEMLQFTEAGVPLMQALADSLGITTAEYSKMQEQGLISVEMFNNAITDMTTGNGQFAGMLERQSETVTGLISTIKDNFQQIGRDVGTEAFEELRNVLVEIVDKINEAAANGSLQEWTEDVGEDIANATKFFFGLVEGIIKCKDALLIMGAGYLAFKVGFAGGAVIAAAINLFKDLKIALQGTTVKQLALNVAMNSNPIGLVVGAIGALIAVLGTAYSLYGDVETASDKYNESMETAIENGNRITENSEREIALLSHKADEYEKLRTKQERTAGEEKRLLDLATELQAVMPNTVSLIDEQTGAYNSLGSSIDDVIEKMKTKAILESKQEAFNEAVVQNSEIDIEGQKRIVRQGTFGNTEKSSFFDDYAELGRIIEAENQIKIYEENEKIIQEFTDLMASSGDYSSPSSSSTDNSSSEIKTNTASTKAQNGIDDFFKTKYEALNHARNMDKISEEEYLKRLDEMIKPYQNKPEYRSYIEEAYKLNQQLADDQTELAEKAAEKQKKLADEQLELAEKAAEEKEKLLIEAAEEEIRIAENKIDELENKQEKLQDAQKQFIENQKQAALNSAEQTYNSQKKAIDDQLALERKAYNEKIKMIDDEVKKREELRQDRDIDAEIKAIEDQLQFSNGGQLDDFSRMELEKELSRKKLEKSDIMYNRGVESRKEDAAVELEEAESKATKAQDSLEESYKSTVDKIEQSYVYVDETVSSLDKFMFTTQSEFDELAVTLQNAIAYAKSQLEAATGAAVAIKNNSASGSSYTYNNQTQSVNVTNPHLSDSQIAGIIRDTLGDVD